MAGAKVARPRRWLGALVSVGAIVLWTLLVCYPNPTVFVRNFLRYRRLPIDPKIDAKMAWPLPKKASSIELFVDGVLIPTSDWKQYRVPWYVPTASEVVRSLRGDCESKAVLLGSLLAGQGIPFQVRASFNHIWIDYQGRQPRPGETAAVAYLEGPPGQFGIHWPRKVDWRAFLAVQKEQLWEEMPPARKQLWLLGLVWLAMAALIWPTAPPQEGEISSDWRARNWDLVGRAAWLSAIALGLLAAAPWSDSPPRWTLPELKEVFVLSIAVGAFLAWLSALRPRNSAAIGEDHGLTVFSSFGRRHRKRQVEAGEIDHIRVEDPRGNLRPWLVSAALRTGERIMLAQHRGEVTARASGRRLGLELNRPLVVRSDGAESRANPDEIPRSLTERAARRPAPVALARPRGCDLLIDDTGSAWVMRYPAPGRSWIVLLVMALFPVLLAAALTYALLRSPLVLAFWAGWVVAALFLALSLYLALMLRGEIVARFAGVRVEVGEGELRFYTPERKLERVDLCSVEGVGFGRVEESPTVAVVTPEKVLHLRDLCAIEHRGWVRQQVEEAILRAS